MKKFCTQVAGFLFKEIVIVLGGSSRISKSGVVAVLCSKSQLFGRFEMQNDFIDRNNEVMVTI